MNLTSNPELGWGVDKNSINPIQSTCGKHFLALGEPGAVFGQNHSLTPPIKGWESQISVLWESPQWSIIFSLAPLSSWLQVQTRGRQKSMSAFQKAGDKWTCYLQNSLSALKSKKENVQKTYRQDKKKKKKLLKSVHWSVSKSENNLWSIRTGGEAMVHPRHKTFPLPAHTKGLRSSGAFAVWRMLSNTIHSHNSPEM